MHKQVSPFFEKVGKAKYGKEMKVTGGLTVPNDLLLEALTSLSGSLKQSDIRANKMATNLTPFHFTVKTNFYFSHLCIDRRLTAYNWIHSLMNSKTVFREKKHGYKLKILLLTCLLKLRADKPLSVYTVCSEKQYWRSNRQTIWLLW